MASLGALRKGTNDDGTPVARVVFDGTHGVNINQAIKVRDQGAVPRAPVVMLAMKDKADAQAVLLGLVVDIEGARSVVPVREEDWRHQCCRVGEDAGLYVQTVGTFGLESAACCWERAAGALSRLTQYVVSTRAVFWLNVVADDLDIEAAGLPSSCVGGVDSNRTEEGARRHRGRMDGVWSRSISRSGRMGGEVVQGLERSRDREHSCGGGRRWTSFIHCQDVGVRELSAIYRFLAVEERDVVRPLLAYVLLTLSPNVITSIALHAIFLFAQLWESTHRPATGPWGSAHGGPYHDEGEQLRKDLSPWLAVRLTPEHSPRAFRTDGESHRVTSGLEACAVLMGLKFLVPPHMNGDSGKHLVVAPVLTDNQENGPRTFKAPLLPISAGCGDHGDVGRAESESHDSRSTAGTAGDQRRG